MTPVRVHTAFGDDLGGVLRRVSNLGIMLVELAGPMPVLGSVVAIEIRLGDDEATVRGVVAHKHCQTGVGGTFNAIGVRMLEDPPARDQGDTCQR